MKLYKKVLSVVLAAFFAATVSFAAFAEEAEAPQAEVCEGVLIAESAEAIAPAEAVEAVEAVKEETTSPEAEAVPKEIAEADLLSSGTFTVRFDTKCEERTIDAVPVNEGGTVGEPAALFRHSYVFSYWYLNDVQTAYDFNTPITKDITLTALWAKVGWNLKTGEGTYYYQKADGSILKNDWKAKDEYLLYVGGDGCPVKNGEIIFEGKTYHTDVIGALIVDGADAELLYREKFALGEDSPAEMNPEKIAFLDGSRNEIQSLDAPLSSVFAADPKTKTDYHGDTGWIFYPAERLTVTGYEKFGKARFFYGSGGTKVSNTTLAIGGLEYDFDQNGVNTNSFLKFYANNGATTVPVVKEYVCGVPADVSKCDFTRPNYHCIGWNTKADGTGTFYPIDKTFYPQGDMTLYAVWELNPHMVTFHANGHGTAPAAMWLKVGDTVPEPSAPSEAYYEFTGWFKDAGCTAAWNFSTDTVPDYNITLYAGWKYVNSGSSGSYSGGGGSSGGSGSNAVYFTGVPGNPVTGTWWADFYGKWHFKTTQEFRNTWAYISYGKGYTDWFWFDKSGIMLTGWQLINMKWYFLNPLANERYGACQLGGKTPDGYTLNADGSWAGY